MQDLLNAMRYNIEEKEKIIDKVIAENDALERENAELRKHVETFCMLTQACRKQAD